MKTTVTFNLENAKAWSKQAQKPMSILVCDPYDVDDRCISKNKRKN